MSSKGEHKLPASRGDSELFVKGTIENMTIMVAEKKSTIAQMVAMEYFHLAQLKLMTKNVHTTIWI